MNRQPADFLGSGIDFPLRFDDRNRLALASGVDDIEKSMKIIIMTAPGERPMRPRFGCRIWEYVFAPINPGTLKEMAFAVQASLSEWEPRVVVHDVKATTDPDTPSTVRIAVAYEVRATNDRRNLVYPFYVIPEEGET